MLNHTVEQQREANLFAMCLLMPEPLLRQYIDANKVDVCTEDGVRSIAIAFQVTEQIMLIRLKQLKIIEVRYDLRAN